MSTRRLKVESKEDKGLVIVDGLLEQYKNNSGLDVVIHALVNRVKELESTQVEIINTQKLSSPNSNLDYLPIGNNVEIISLKVANATLVENICYLEEKIDSLEKKLENVTFCLQGYVSKDNNVQIAEMENNIERRRRLYTEELKLNDYSENNNSDHVIANNNQVNNTTSPRNPTRISYYGRSNRSILRMDSDTPTSSEARPATREGRPVSRGELRPSSKDGRRSRNQNKEEKVVALSTVPTASSEILIINNSGEGKEAKLMASINDEVAEQSNNGQKNGIEESIDAKTEILLSEDPFARSKFIKLKWRKSIRKIILSNRITKILKFCKGDVGMENARLPSHMSLLSRLENVEKGITELDKHRINHDSFINSMREDIRDKVYKKDFKSYCDQQKTSVEKFNQDLVASIEKIKIDFKEETGNLSTANRNLQNRVEFEVEPKVDRVEQKTWETSNTLFDLDKKLTKCEIINSENTDSIHQIQAEQVRPAGTGSQNTTSTDWSVLLEYQRRFTHLIIKKFNNDETPGQELRGVLQKILKEVTNCIEFAKILKTCDDTKSKDSKKFTKELEILSWTLYAVIKRDREFHQGLGGIEGWISLESLPFGDETTKLKTALIELSFFVHDAARLRVDTSYMMIQIKELELCIKSLQESKTKHNELIVKLRDALGERAKSSVIYNYFERVDAQFMSLSKMIGGVKDDLEIESRKETGIISSLEANMQQAILQTTNALQTVAEELKHKVGAEELQVLDKSVNANIEKLSFDIPTLTATVNQKAGMEDLQKLKTELFSAMEDSIFDSISYAPNNNSAILSGKSYCLSCTQPIQTNSIPNNLTIKISGPETVDLAREKVTIGSLLSPSNKGIFPPSNNTTWNPTIASPKGLNITLDNKVILPGIGGSRSKDPLKSPTHSSVIVSDRLITTKVFSKSGTVTTG